MSNTAVKVEGNEKPKMMLEPYTYSSQVANNDLVYAPKISMRDKTWSPPRIYRATKTGWRQDAKLRTLTGNVTAEPVQVDVHNVKDMYKITDLTMFLRSMEKKLEESLTKS